MKTFLKFAGVLCIFYAGGRCVLDVKDNVVPAVTAWLEAPPANVSPLCRVISDRLADSSGWRMEQGVLRSHDKRLSVHSLDLQILTAHFVDGEKGDLQSYLSLSERQHLTRQARKLRDELQQQTADEIARGLRPKPPRPEMPVVDDRPRGNSGFSADGRLNPRGISYMLNAEQHEQAKTATD